MIKPARVDRDHHRHPAIFGGRRIADRIDLHFVITARPIVGLKPARNIGDPAVGIRLLQKVEQLAAQRFGAVNRFAGEIDHAEGILAAFGDRDGGVHPRPIRGVVVDRLVHLRVEITVRDVKAVNEIGAFLDIRGDERKFLLKARITFARRADRVVEQGFGRLILIADEVHHPERDERAFVDVEAQPVARTRSCSAR